MTSTVPSRRPEHARKLRNPFWWMKSCFKSPVEEHAAAAFAGNSAQGSPDKAVIGAGIDHSAPAPEQISSNSYLPGVDGVQQNDQMDQHPTSTAENGVQMLYVTREHVHKAYDCCQKAKQNAKGRRNSLQYMDFGDTRVIAFPGTRADKLLSSDFLEDLRTDLCKRLVPARALLGRDGMLHEGFRDRFQDIMKTPEYQAALSGTFRRLIFSGHSLGAAVAIIAALQCLHPDHPWVEGHLELACITFGVPFTTDQSLSYSIHHQGLSQWFHNIVNGHDLISRSLIAPYSQLSAAITRWNSFHHQIHRAAELILPLVNTIRVIGKGILTKEDQYSEQPMFWSLGIYYFYTDTGQVMTKDPLWTLAWLGTTMLSARDADANHNVQQSLDDHALSAYEARVEQFDPDMPLQQQIAAVLTYVNNPYQIAQLLVNRELLRATEEYKKLLTQILERNLINDIKAAQVAKMPRYEDGNLDVREQIAVGRSSSVYLAHDILQKCNMAVKKLTSTEGQEATVQSRDCQVSILEGLRHPNIVSLSGVVHHSSSPSFVMEFCPGANLEVVPDTLDAYQKVDVAVNIAKAVYWCHQQGVVHGAVNKSNIIISTGGECQAKLCGFGQAHYVQETQQAQSGSEAGTSMSSVSLESDVSSFGQLLMNLRPSADDFPGHLVLQHWEQLSSDCQQTDVTKQPKMRQVFHKLSHLRSSLPEQTPVDAQTSELPPVAGTSLTVAGQEWRRQFGLQPDVTWEVFLRGLQLDPATSFVQSATEDQRDMLQANVSVSAVNCGVILRSDFVRAAGTLTLPVFCERAMGSGLEWSQPVIQGQDSGTWANKVMAPSGSFITEWSVGMKVLPMVFMNQQYLQDTPVSLRGKTNQGHWLQEVTTFSRADRTEYVAEQATGFASLLGRGGGWITNMFGLGHDGDRTWICEPSAGLGSSCKVVGYQLRCERKFVNAKFQFASFE